MANKSYIYHDLQVLIDNSGMSNAEVAENVLCCSAVTFAKKMNGKSPFTNRQIALLYTALGIADDKVYRYFIEPCATIYKDVRETVKLGYNPAI